MSTRTFSTEQRRRYAKQGIAMPDGSYPVPDRDALRRAIARFRKDKVGLKAHIIRRARALGATSMLPEGWV